METIGIHTPQVEMSMVTTRKPLRTTGPQRVVHELVDEHLRDYRGRRRARAEHQRLRPVKEVDLDSLPSPKEAEKKAAFPGGSCSWITRRVPRERTLPHKRNQPAEDGGRNGRIEKTARSLHRAEAFERLRHRRKKIIARNDRGRYDSEYQAGYRVLAGRCEP